MPSRFAMCTQPDTCSPLRRRPAPQLPYPQPYPQSPVVPSALRCFWEDDELNEAFVGVKGGIHCIYLCFVCLFVFDSYACHFHK